MKKKCLLGTVLLAGSLLAVQPALGQCADLSLEEAIQIALVNNPDVNITRLGEETAKAKITQARGSNSFSWKASTSFGTSEVDTYGWDTSNSTRITGSLPIYNGKINHNNIESAEIGLDIANCRPSGNGRP